ncbi:MAG: rRNA methyltransferase [Alphaproteobacteria bacterium CG_4_10_14_0_2_um_filter_63_37]|nr:MAG: rRNA methyltransferase [Proteobacteria bacterium CG1_02_64_396]PJA23450.1 MAG: rRNA methyltransferase [Alphaproteobacteria bacterium CG_4_10_14_0_2_um_filter_63_37]
MPSIRQRLRDLGALPGHERLVLRHWLQGAPLDTRRRRAEDFLPKSLRTALPGLSERWHDLARIHGEHPGEDGSLRLLVRLADGQTVESVLLPRDGLCVSTQVGCAVGCLFCMTGKSGLIRQLSSDEIVAQVTLARARRRVKKVVFMGMGEPLHNLDNVMEAIDLLGTEGGIGHKNLVFSTVGDRPLFARLQAGAVKPALAISLHTTDPALRRRLLPKAPDIDPAELIALGDDYGRATDYPIQYQWTLLEGINDTDAELEALARLLAGKYGMLNLIPYNSGSEMGFQRPSWERAAAMARHLHRCGVLTKLRHSAGQDVEGGCGQLRARALGESA